jgi:micrococcal nuclease
LILVSRAGRPDRKSPPPRPPATGDLAHTPRPSSEPAPASPPTQTQATAPAPPVPKGSSTQAAASHPAPFDPESARHLAHARVLAGRAWVTDGDTIRIKNTQIRLFGVDAPELNHPHGKNAKWALHRLCKGHTVRAEITDVDDYGRTVARCFLPDGRDLSAEMVKQGLALDWRKYSDGRYRHLEPSDARKKLFLADARQRGHMHVWKTFEARQGRRG